MPKYKIDYQKAKIYRICCKDVNISDCYIESTTNMIRRKSSHKCACNNKNVRGYNFNVCRFIRENGGWDNWSMIVVEDFPCDSKHELETRERFHIEDLHSTLNRYVPTRTDKEYQRENAEHIKDYQKEWRLDNEDYIKQYRKDNLEHIKAQNKEYNKEYRVNNAEQVKTRAKEKIPCPHCNMILSRCSMRMHIKTQHTQ